MFCRFCRVDEVLTGIVPLPYKHQEADQGPFGCRLCMIERDLWCAAHDTPHSEWNTGGHLCLACHSLLFSRLLPRASKYYRFLLETLPGPNAKALCDWAEDEDNWIPVAGEDRLVLWSLAAMALIRNQPFRVLLEHVAEKVDLEPVIPRGFPITVG